MFWISSRWDFAAPHEVIAKAQTVNVDVEVIIWMLLDVCESDSYIIG
jgi:hypothetical protein